MLLNRCFYTLKSHIVADSLLMLLIDKISLQVGNLKLESDIFILNYIQLSLNFIDIFLSGYLSFKGTDLRPPTQFSL